MADGANTDNLILTIEALTAETEPLTPKQEFVWRYLLNRLSESETQASALTAERDELQRRVNNLEKNGIRTSKKVNGVLRTYTLDGTKILRETWNGNTLVPLYDNEDGVCGILYNNIPYYFIKNLQGDIIAIIDKDAQTVAR